MAKLATKPRTTTKPAETKVRSTAARTTKRDTILALLKSSSGATLAELVKATRWQPHSVRAFLTSLRKSGLSIERTERDGASCYVCRAAA